MSESKQQRLMRELGYEWGLSITESTLSHLERLPPHKPVDPYLVALDKAVAERAASLIEEGLSDELATIWEESARDAISERLAAHDEDLSAAA